MNVSKVLNRICLENGNLEWLYLHTIIDFHDGYQSVGHAFPCLSS